MITANYIGAKAKSKWIQTPLSIQLALLNSIIKGASEKTSVYV